MEPSLPCLVWEFLDVSHGKLAVGAVFMKVAFWVSCHTLTWRFAKCGSQAGCISPSWELAQDTNSQAPPQTDFSRKLWGGAQRSVLITFQVILAKGQSHCPQSKNTSGQFLEMNAGTSRPPCLLSSRLLPGRAFEVISWNCALEFPELVELGW